MPSLKMMPWLRAIVVFAALCSASYASANERILALSPHICEMLYAIHAEQDIVGAMDYCDYPQAAKNIPRIADYSRVNLEAATRLKPTLAIVLNKQAADAKTLQTFGVKLVQSNPLSVQEVIHDIERLGEATHHEKEALVLSENLQLRLNKLKQQTKEQHIPVYYDLASQPMLTVGKHTFIHDVLKQLGLKNVFGDVGLDAPRTNVEAVVAMQPQIIIVPSNHDISERSQFWHAWLGKGIQVVRITPDLIHRPGPRLLDGMEELFHAIHQLKP